MALEQVEISSNSYDHCRDKLEYYITIKKQADDFSPVDLSLIDGIQPRDVKEYLIGSPGDLNFFDRDILAQARAAENDDINLFDEALDLGDDYKDRTNVVNEPVTEDDTITYQTEPVPEKDMSDVVLFDQNEDPLLNRELEDFFDKYRHVFEEVNSLETPSDKEVYVWEGTELPEEEVPLSVSRDYKELPMSLNEAAKNQEQEENVEEYEEDEFDEDEKVEEVARKK